MYSLKRISKHPATALRVAVDNQEPGSQDAGFLGGGTFYFMPAGQEGDTAQVNAHAARVIMGDAGMREHFECTPPLDGPAEPTETAQAEPEKAAAGKGQSKATGRQK